MATGQPPASDLNTVDAATWTDIEGALIRLPPAVGEDEGKYSRAYVSYEKSGKTYRAQMADIGPIEGAELLGGRISVGTHRS